MRTKVIIDGLNNTQKFRAVINGIFIGDCQIKDLMGNRFPQREQRVAVWDALMRLAIDRRITPKYKGIPTGVLGDFQGYQVQVDLV
jgi:hypothetical protein